MVAPSSKMFRSMTVSHQGKTELQSVNSAEIRQGSIVSKMSYIRNC